LTSSKRHRVILVICAIMTCLLPASACSSALAPTSTTEDGILRDGLSQINIQPVNYGGLQLVKATFGTVAANRPVDLQHKTDAGWKRYATAKQDDYGEAEFLVPFNPNETYRAIALEAEVKGVRQPEVATSAATIGSNWEAAFSEDFSGTTLSPRWEHRATGLYSAADRHCSATYETNVALAAGKAELSVTHETNRAHIVAARSAGCPAGMTYLRNAMIDTDGRFSAPNGLAAARVKFPQEQGTSASIWLQSHAQSTITFVESQGYGVGLRSSITVNGTRYPLAAQDTDVDKKYKQDPAWWAEYHVYSVEWDANSVVFRVDGVQTRRLDRLTPETNYFLVISLLSFDSQQKKFGHNPGSAHPANATASPQSMLVDWVQVWAPHAAP
jgi:hypothetical protein